MQNNKNKAIFYLVKVSETRSILSLEADVFFVLSRDHLQDCILFVYPLKIVLTSLGK